MDDMMKIIRFVKVIIVVGLLCTSAKAQKTSETLWFYSFSLSMGADSYDRWTLYFPSFLIPDAMPPSEGVSLVSQVDATVAYRLDDFWSFRFGIAYQHSQTHKEDNNIWLYGGKHKQNYLSVPLTFEHVKGHFLYDMGAAIVYEMANGSMTHYPAGVVRPSRFFIAPNVGLGFRIPLADNSSLRIGAHITCALVRYGNFGEDSKTVKYNHLHASPTCLLSLAYEFKPRR